MAKHKSRAVRLAEAVDIARNALSVVEELQEEMDNWRCNMEGTNLESTAKYDEVGECADALEAGRDEIENALDELEGVEFPGAFGR